LAAVFELFACCLFVAYGQNNSLIEVSVANVVWPLLGIIPKFFDETEGCEFRVAVLPAGITSESLEN